MGSGGEDDDMRKVWERVEGRVDGTEKVTVVKR